MRRLSDPLRAMTLITACVLIVLVGAAIVIQDYPDLSMYEGPSPFIIKTLPTEKQVTVQRPEMFGEVGLSYDPIDDNAHLDARHRTPNSASQIVCVSLPLLI